MFAQLGMADVVERLNPHVLDRAVHAFDLAVWPRMVRLGQSVVNAVGLADIVEADWPESDGVPVPALLGDLTAPRHCHSDQWRSNGSIGQNGVGLIGHGLEHVQQKPLGSLSISCFDKLADGKFGSPINANEETELALGSLHLSDVASRSWKTNCCRATDVKEAYGVALEFPALGLVGLNVGQTRDSAPLQASMQGSPRQIWDRQLQGTETIAQRQHRVAPECNDHRLLGLCQSRRSRLRRPVFTSSTVARIRHFATVLQLMPNDRLRCARKPCHYRDIALQCLPGHRIAILLL